MLESLLKRSRDVRVYQKWIDIDFTTYASGVFNFVDSASGIAFNRAGGTIATTLDEGVMALNLDGSGTLTAGSIPDRLGDNDWKITMVMKVKTGTNNHMLFCGRSIQGNGSGMWNCDMFPDGRLDWWYNGNNSLRKTSTKTISRGVYHTVIYESLNNVLKVTVDGEEFINSTIGNINTGPVATFAFLIGGSADNSIYHSRIFLRSFKIETKQR